MSEAPRLGVDGVLRALEQAAAKGMDREKCCQFLRNWGEQRKITGKGMQIVPEDVEAAIAKWAPALSNQAPVNPLSANPSAQPVIITIAEPRAQVAQNLAPKSQEQEATAQGPQQNQAPETTKPQRKEQESPNKRAAPAGESKAKRLKRERMEERERQEKEEEARLKELAKEFDGLSGEEVKAKRLNQVLKEMDGRMTEIALRATGERNMSRFLENISDMGERRELYLRMVHKIQEAVQVPETFTGELMPYQLEGLEWLVSLYVNNLHGILADEMGLGKTIQTIALLLYIKEFKQNKGPHLVIAPKSTLSNWMSEFEKFAPGHKVYLWAGDFEERAACEKKMKKRIKHDKTVVVMTNYEQMHQDANKWLRTQEWQLVIIDEGHRMKNSKSVFHEIMATMKMRTRLLLTGTPLQNNLNELWSLLHYLLPDLFPNAQMFESWFTEPFRALEGVNEYETFMSVTPEDENMIISRLHTMLSPFMIQRTKSEVLGEKLPPRTDAIIRIPLSAWQHSAYKDLEQRTIQLLQKDDTVSSQKVNNALMQLRKIVLHPYLFLDTYENGVDLYRTSGKFEVLDRIIPKLLRFDHKVLIFSQFTSVLDILQSYFEWKALRFCRLDGQVSHENRKEQIRLFQSVQEIKFFMLSARAGGLGLNLQAADTVLLFDMDWNPQNDKQAIARAYRIGQLREVKVIKFITISPVEKHMERRTAEKLEMEKKIIAAGGFQKNVTQEQRSETLRKLLGLNADGTAIAKSEEKVPEDHESTSPEELNRLISRSEEERIAFGEMDKEMFLKIDPAKDPALPLLVRCNRLMAEQEVPQGFAAGGDEEDMI